MKTPHFTLVVIALAAGQAVAAEPAPGTTFPTTSDTYQSEGGAPTPVATTPPTSAVRNTATAQPPPMTVKSFSPDARYWSVAVQGGYRFMIGGGPSKGGLFDSTPLLGLHATIHNFLTKNLNLEIFGFYGWSYPTLNTGLVKGLTGNFSVIDLGVGLHYEIRASEQFSILAGIHVALDTFSRSFDSSSYIAPPQSYTSVNPGAMLGLRYRFTPAIAFSVRGRINYITGNLDSTSGSWSVDVLGVLEYSFGGSQ